MDETNEHIVTYGFKLSDDWPLKLRHEFRFSMGTPELAVMSLT